jgi:nicotinamidase-related amidase
MIIINAINQEGKMAETKIERKKTAFLVIDMQSDLVKDEAGPFAEVVKRVRANRAIENTARVLRAGREAKIPVFHIKTVHRADGADMWPGVTTDYVLEGVIPASVLEEMAKRMVEGTSGADFVDELKPVLGEYVIAKRRSSAFYGTDLEMLLRCHGVNTLIFAGVVTSGCVEATAHGAYDRDFNVIILSDCCADMTDEAHEYTMRLAFKMIARVRTSKEVIAALKG